MFGRIMYVIGQILLTVAILTFVGYRVALLMDWVPKDFSPSGMVYEQYEIFKADLKRDSSTPDISGKISRTVLKVIDKTETYFDEKNKADDAEAALAAKCKENPLIRWFMFMGKSDAEKQECIIKQPEGSSTNPDADLKKKMDEAIGVTTPKSK